MKLTLDEIARTAGGTVEGDGSTVITGAAGLSEAKAGDISFLSNPRYADAVAGTRASAVIVSADWKGKCSCALVRVKNPDRAFATLVPAFAPPPPAFAPGVHPTAVVAAGVLVGRDVHIGPHCVLEKGAAIGDRTVLIAGCYIGHDVSVGSDCRFYPHASIRERCTIGNRVIVHNGAVIGSDGFGYVKDEQGRWQKIPQVGIVEIGDDVEIGANVTVDRARFGKTVIASGVKIDNLVQIAHNVRIGENTAMAAQVGISGSTTVGRNVQLGGQAGVAGHLTVGDNSVVGAQAGVTKDVKPATFVSGYPAMPHDRAKRIHAHLMNLPALKERVDELSGRRKKADRTDEGK